MKYQRKLWLILALFSALAICGFVLVRTSQAADPTYTLDWYVVGAGGTGDTQLASTVGQNVIGWSTGTHQLGSGFWYGDLKSMSKVYLPILLKQPK